MKKKYCPPMSELVTVNEELLFTFSTGYSFGFDPYTDAEEEEIY